MPQNLLFTRIAISLIFLLTGIAMSCWAPMVPYAKMRLGLDEEQLGLLLLALGGGAITMMPTGSFFINRFGSKKTILIGSLLITIVFPFLTVIQNPIAMAVALFVFGGAIGTTDVAMNTQAVILEKKWGSPIMSSLHGLYSVGGILGAASIAVLLNFGLSLLACSLVVASLFLGIVALQYPRLLPHSGEDAVKGSLFAIPRGFVILIGALCFIAFLAEGALLDWSAVYLKYFRNVEESRAGIGFAVFSATMSVGRLTGDYVAARIGIVRGLWYGAWLAAIGYFIAVGLESATGTIIGFGLTGLGLSNIVPLLFSAAGNLKNPPPGVAIPAVTIMGYTGLLLGPASIGFVAKKTSLSISFLGIGILLLAIAFSAKHMRRS